MQVLLFLKKKERIVYLNIVGTITHMLYSFSPNLINLKIFSTCGTWTAVLEHYLS